MHDRIGAGHEECTAGSMQGIKKASTTGRMQDMNNTCQKGCRAFGMHDSIGVGHEEFTTGGVQDMKNA